MVHPCPGWRSRAVMALLAAALGVMAGCGGQQPRPASATPSTAGSPAGSTATPTASSATATAHRPARTASSPTPAARTHGAGTVVVLDPGHNGGNGAHPEVINRLVPAGRGISKACNTTGTATNAGYPEHAFTFAVAVRVAALLRKSGVTVLLTRSNDSGVGPCVNTRAAIGNRANAAAAVSIHADGASPSGHGFHIAYSSPPLNTAQSGPALRLARSLRDRMRAAGFGTSNYLGSAGLDGRNDLGGLNLSTRPAALIECGNMRNAGEAAVFASASGRAHYARAIAAGIIAYLGG
ncbi:MAG: N-acetylmuramoyl-L-alanine amidase [Sciscionella sp.]